MNNLAHELEQGDVKYKLCLHTRDWAPGVEISSEFFTMFIYDFFNISILHLTAQISNSVNESKRTIIVMSKNYLESNWAQWEFRVAQSHAAVERRSRIIIILYEDIGDINELQPDIRDYLNLNTYVKWGDMWFWEKLKLAMPQVNCSNQNGQSPAAESNDDQGETAQQAVLENSELNLDNLEMSSLNTNQLTTNSETKLDNDCNNNNVQSKRDSNTHA